MLEFHSVKKKVVSGAAGAYLKLCLHHQKAITPPALEPGNRPSETSQQVLELALGELDRLLKNATDKKGFSETKIKMKKVQVYAIFLNYFAKDGVVNYNGVLLPSFFSAKDSNVVGVLIYEAFDLLFCPSIDKLGYFSLYDEGPYELREVQVKKDDIVFDCGANIGMFSAVAASKGAKVYAFEPVKSIVDDYLSKTAELNPSIKIVPKACSNKNEEIIINIDDSAIGSNRLDSVVMESSLNITNSYAVSAIKLDDFVSENNIPRVDFIKADIEGAERFMLEGAKNIMKQFKPKLSICTYHLPDDPKVLREIILDANPTYTIFEDYKKLYAY